MLYKMNYVRDTKPTAIQPKAVKGASRNQHPAKPQPSKNTRPLDPDDLTRRLYLVLAEQKTYAERKRRARAAVEAERQAKVAAAARNAGHMNGVVSSHVNTQHHPQPNGIPLRPAAGNRMREKVLSLPSLRVRTKDINNPSHQERDGVAEQVAEKTENAGSKPSEGSSKVDSQESSPTSYRHVPQVAASQFARTTTVETVTEKHLVHRLSRHAMKFHMDGPNATAGATADTAPCETNKALRQAQSIREKQYERNQFQQSQTFSASPSNADEKRHSASPHTLHEWLKSRGLDHDEQAKAQRRKSAGSILGRVAPVIPEASEMPNLSPTEQHPVIDHCEVALPVNPDEHRVDWTQRDEAISQQKSASGHPLLRKAESRWALRVKRVNLSKQGKVDKLPSPRAGNEKVSPVEGLTSPTKTTGFFARFRR